MLRGGPAVLNPPTLNYSVYLSTNGSKKLFLEGNFYSNVGKYKSSESFGVEASATFKPGKSFSVSLSPSYSTRENKMQYITTQYYGEESRYILGTISQKIAMMSVRINYNITPELTIQYWGQPFLASMDYRDFKMITDPKADKFTDRFHTFQGTEISYNPVDNFYSVDENKDGSEDYSFDNPNLNVNEFLSNLVARWEFRPGSTLFLVWSQSRDYYDTAGKFEFRDNLTNLFSEERPSDIFLIKFTYRFGLR
jgi:hypothetical protein